jgi:hypothetical protein
MMELLKQWNLDTYTFIDNAETIAQLVLIDSGLRRAWLLGNPQFEYSNLRSLLLKFPNIKKSYTKNRGIIVSKNDYTDISFTDTEIGKLLGYLCYNEYVQLSLSSSGRYSIHIFCCFNNKVICNIFTNTSLNLDKLSEFKLFAQKAEKILLNDNLTRTLVEKVVVCTRYIPA